jgi:glycosyltransferase involved in cell wall biosynthesis
MRIAYVINSVEGGGASQPVPAIARVMRDQGAEVRVFALTPRDRRGLPAMIEAGLDPLVRDGGTTDHVAAGRWLQRELAHWGATHIWTSLSRATILGLLIGPALGLPVISWQHAAFLKPWNRRLMRLLERRAMLWVGDSQSVTALTAERLKVGKDRLMCWPIFAADPTSPLASSWQPGGSIRVGSLGRLHPVKGYDILIAALARLQTGGFVPHAPFEVTVAGDGAERDRLEALVRSEDVRNIRFTGYVGDPAGYLASLHLYLQPSRSEGFCIAAHEAMAAGLPVIASTVGELPWTIEPEKTGLLVPPDDSDALASALGNLLSDPARLDLMGKAARQTILNRYSQAKFAASGAAIFDHIRPKLV